MQALTPILLAALLAAAGTAQADIKVGEAAPDFTASDSHGKTQRLSDYRGQVVVLEWTNHECPFVVKHYESGNMQALQKEAAARDVVWLSVISSAPGKQGHVGPEEANRLTESRQAAPAAVILDPTGEVGQRYGAKTTPHMYIVDPEGTLVYQGGIDSIKSTRPEDVARATPYVKVALDELMAGKAVTNPTTAPYGCSVKY